MAQSLFIIKILQKLAVEMFNVSRGLSPEIGNELFQFREEIPYELRQRPQFQIPWVHSNFTGTENLKFGLKIWALVSNKVKQFECFRKFRNAIKQWKHTSCPCRLCKIYIKFVLKNDHVFFSFYFISLYEVTCQLPCNSIVVRWL